MVGDSCVNGTLRDLSQGGFFFEPEAAYVDGEFVSGSAVSSALDVEPGSKVNILIELGDYTTMIPSEIRWSGYHPSHECHGVGCEFSRN
jgi:hypothetical protein